MIFSLIKHLIQAKGILLERRKPWLDGMTYRVRLLDCHTCTEVGQMPIAEKLEMQHF